MNPTSWAEAISLDGPWSFSLGEGAPWSDLQVPGCWEAQGFSKWIEGPGHYRRMIPIPRSWSGRTIRAEFDAVSYACRVLWNGAEVGSHRGLWTPFSVDLSQQAHPGEANTLELIVYKPGRRYPMRSSLAGFLPDLATTFGGIWQPARLRSFNAALEHIHILPDPEDRCLHVSALVEQAGPQVMPDAWSVEIFREDRLAAGQVLPVPDDLHLGTVLRIPELELWSPDSPALYTARLRLFYKGQEVAQASRRTGFRRLSADGPRLLLNGRPILLRGVLSWGWEPDRIAPAYTAGQARAEMRRVRALGFNAIKLCLFVPNPAYFDIADEEGMLLWEEFPLWLPEVTEELRLAAPVEYAAIADQTRRHPSVVLYSLGCELNQSVDAGLLGELNQVVRSSAAGALVCDNSGSGEAYNGLDLDFSDFSDYHPYCDLHYFEPLLDNWRRDWKPPRPGILGEFCDSDTFRDLDEIASANGGTKPWWLTPDNPVTAWRPESQAMLAEQERLASASLGFSAAELVKISYAQSLAIRKYMLEALRRRTDMSGYVITGLRDTPISTSGIWDDLGRAKWPPEAFLPINGEAILCLDVNRRRSWISGGDRPEKPDPYNLRSGEPWRWRVILSHAGEPLPAGSPLHWSLSGGEGQPVAGGEVHSLQVVPPGTPREIGTIDCQIPIVQSPVELRLEIGLQTGGQEVKNSWPIWVYPPLPAPPGRLGVIDPGGLLVELEDWLSPVEKLAEIHDLSPFPLLLSTLWDARLAAYLESGGKLLLLQPGGGPLPARRCPFWREAIHLFYDHPLWRAFPQRGYADMQFFGLASDAAFDPQRVKKAFPGLEDLRPLMRRLDAREFHVSDHLFEARFGKGTLLACSLRLQGGAGSQPRGRQRNVAGISMLSALLGYLADGLSI